MADKHNQEVNNGNQNQLAGRDIINLNVEKFIDNSDYLARKLPSKIAVIIPILSQALKKIDDTNLGKRQTTPYDITNKIEHNDLREYRVIVEKYGQYRQVLDATYEEIDNQDPGVKGNILRFINLRYDGIKANCLKGVDINNHEEVMRILREKSDYIMREVKRCIKDTVTLDPTFKISIEELEFCLVIIVCHAFIACKILEEPPNDYS